MAYNFGQMFQKKGIQGQAGGGVPSYPPTPTKPPVPQAGGGKPSQQLLGPPVQDQKPAPGSDGGPSYHPGPIGPPARPYPYPQPPVPGGPGPKGTGDRGRAMIGQPGGQWGMLPPGGGRPPVAPPSAPPQGGQASPMTMPDGSTAYIWQGRAYPYDPTDPANAGMQDPYGQPQWQPTPVPGGGRMPNPGGPQPYMPYFNPAGGIRYDPNNPGIPGAYY